MRCMHLSRVFDPAASGRDELDDLGVGVWVVRGETPAGDLPRFLPNSGNSVYAASGLLRSWPAAGPRELWRAEVGWGKSAVVEVAGAAFTLGEIDDRQCALCLDPLTGAVRWKQELLAKPNRHFAWGPVTSPLVDEDRLYVIPYDKFEDDVWEMRCPIICFRTDGTLLWRAEKDVWATEASTPLIVGDTLYVAPTIRSTRCSRRSINGPALCAGPRLPSRTSRTNSVRRHR